MPAAVRRGSSRRPYPLPGATVKIGHRPEPRRSPRSSEDFLIPRDDLPLRRSKKEILMRKKFLDGLGTASLAVSLFCVSLPAQAADTVSTVPFSFTVNGKTLPPGDYRVSLTRGILFVRGLGNGAFALVTRTESREVAREALVFHKYGERYFLREARMGGGTGAQLPEPREEQKLAEQRRQGKAAVASSERVEVPVN